MATTANSDTAIIKAADIRVLIVDNDAAHAHTVAESLKRVGFDCSVATSGNQGAKMIEDDSFDIVITDLKMADIDGLELLKRTKQSSPQAEVILVTGHGTVASAVFAMKEGAFNYLQKPLDLGQLRVVTEKAAEATRLRWVNAELSRRLDEKYGFEGVVGSSSQMNAVIERLKRIAPTDASVLISGETGTGKELVAQSIHQNSPRKNKAFVALNCAALSENILESELFGHVKGAFTDASADRIGKFEYAHGGTLFLDEVGDMPMATQIKLLRVLENGVINRVGSNEPIKVNVRILSATNQNLEDAIAAGTFRSDLYHRLKVVTIALPRLADRAGYSAVDRALHTPVCPAASQADQKHVAGGAHETDDLQLARQRARIAQHDRKHGGGGFRWRAGRGRSAAGIRRAGRPNGSRRSCCGSADSRSRVARRQAAGRNRKAVHRRNAEVHGRQSGTGGRDAWNRRTDSV